MNKPVYPIVLSSLLLAAGLQTASAGSMRCGTHVISSGQGNSPGQYEVLKRCGEPDARQGDTWIYEKSSSVTKQIRFDSNGTIIEIR
jgi:hypothetical protein